MLDNYLRGTLPQLIERGRLLKEKIPRTLPRDYERLISACNSELDSIIRRLRDIQQAVGIENTTIQQAQLRKFRRAVTDLDHVETTGIVVLNRVHEDDHRANQLLYQICQEIKYPWITPTVTTLSTEYFYIDTKLNLMFIPLAEVNFLLHLPDLYHELGHSLLTTQDHPVLDRLRACYLKCTDRIHDYFAEKKEELRTRSQAFKQSFEEWEFLWTEYWLREFFCDLFAILTLGPAFAWAHLHLYMKKGGDGFAVPSDLRIVTHPADDARMQALLVALHKIGFVKDAHAIEDSWTKALRLTDETPKQDYVNCYPNELIFFVVEKVSEGVKEMACRIASPETTDPIHLRLNEAWEKFWADPEGYHRWESDAVKQLMTTIIRLRT